MTAPLSNRLLWIASAAMLGLSVAAIALAMAIPIDAAVAAVSPGISSETMRGPSRISREQLERDASRQLRQPLLDAPPPAADSPAVVPQAPLPPLLGTIVEPGRSLALVQILGTTIGFKRVGDTIADAKIVAIDVTGMTVVRQGHILSVRINQPESAKTILGASVLSRRQESAP
jgi:hypothetical protein